MISKPKTQVETRQFQFSPDSATPTVAVAETIAFATDQDPLDMTPLAHVIEPDALERLLASNGDVTISFEIEDVEVTVDSSGKIVVSESE